MTEQAIATQEQSDLSLAEYGSRGDVAALSRRVRSMMPGGDKLTPEQAMAAAQYAILADANPFRGEVYAYPDKRGKLVLVEGYKLLVRWAKRQCNYSDRYDRLDDLPEGEDIGYRCWILRDDARQMLQQFTQAGATFQEAFEIAATSAVGVVRKADMWSSRYNKPIPPPNGWTWDQVARKRALKNALNLSHGAPSPREIASESWKVGETDTIREDWQECTPGMAPEARARLAQITAWNRQHEAEPGTPETLEHNQRLLHGDDGDLDLTAASKPTPKPEPVPVEETGNGNGRIWPPQVIEAAIETRLAKDSYQAVGRLNLSTLDPGDAEDMILNWLKIYDEARATADKDGAAVIANAWLAGEMKDAEGENDG